MVYPQFKSELAAKARPCVAPHRGPLGRAGSRPQGGRVMALFKITLAASLARCARNEGSSAC